MQATTHSLLNIFSEKKRFAIPLFQRPYVWSEDRQWAPLWEDLRQKADEIASGSGEGRPEHFLGAIVIGRRDTTLDDVPAWDVIDGQQRLTTFQVLLAALRHIAVEFALGGIAEEITAFIRNPVRAKGRETDRFKLWPTHADIKPFTEVMDAKGRAEIETLYAPKYVRRKLQSRPPLVEAYLYFHSAIRSYAESHGTAAAPDAVDHVFKALERKLQLVAIQLGPQDDPQTIFETLNARGEPLLPSDLLKNFLFLRASAAKENPEDLYSRYWKWFDTEPGEPADGDRPFWKAEERQGRLKRPRLDLFIQHFLAFKTSEEVNIGQLFQQYKAWSQGAGRYTSVEAELTDLQQYARQFRAILGPKPTDRLGRFAERLRDLDTSTVHPLLLGVLTDPRVTTVERDGILTDLESFLIRRLVCGLTTKGYNRHFLQLSKLFVPNPTAPVPTRVLFREQLTKADGETVDWPEDDAFRRSWLDLPVYENVKVGRIEMILKAVEFALANPKTEQVTVHGDLTVEHVLPQEWEAHWPLHLQPQHTPAEREAAESRRDKILHTFGNLTLLTEKLNPSVSNAAYSLKQAEFAKHSALRLNAYFAQAKSWDEMAIEKRGLDLFEIARTIWPHPGAVLATQAPSNSGG